MQSAHKHQDVSCVPRTEAQRCEVEEMEKSQLGRPCKLSTHHPFTLSYQNPWPAERSLLPTFGGYVTVCWPMGYKCRGLGRASKKEFRFSMCTPFALCPLSSLEPRRDVRGEEATV